MFSPCALCRTRSLKVSCAEEQIEYRIQLLEELLQQQVDREDPPLIEARHLSSAISLFHRIALKGATAI